MGNKYLFIYRNSIRFFCRGDWIRILMGLSAHSKLPFQFWLHRICGSWTPLKLWVDLSKIQTKLSTLTLFNMMNHLWCQVEVVRKLTKLMQIHSSWCVSNLIEWHDLRAVCVHLWVTSKDLLFISTENYTTLATHLSQSVEWSLWACAFLAPACKKGSVSCALG